MSQAEIKWFIYTADQNSAFIGTVHAPNRYEAHQRAEHGDWVQRSEAPLPAGAKFWAFASPFTSEVR